ncbi:MAG: orotate phosphoribosyltransferase [Actinobacteria bacterium]|nr:orotate phosphoribosyltransferase [Actinomycetota bacterium]
MNVAEEFRRLQVHRTGHFELSSGRHSDTYLQCALALQDPDLALRLGEMLADRLREDRPDLAVGVVASPALGGVLAGFVVARALGTRFVFTERRDGRMTLRRGQHVAVGERVLVVEDVVTTGGSAQEAAVVVEAEGGEVVGYAAIVDRSEDFPLTALLRVEAQTWDPDGCPLCAEGQPLDRPGSRPSPDRA